MPDRFIVSVINKGPTVDLSQAVTHNPGGAITSFDNKLSAVEYATANKTKYETIVVKDTVNGQTIVKYHKGSKV